MVATEEERTLEPQEYEMCERSAISACCPSSFMLCFDNLWQ